MNSLEIIKRKIKELELKIESYELEPKTIINEVKIDNVNKQLNDYKKIKQDLERLEILEKENQELKETLNKLRKMGLEIIEENKQLSNELHKLNCYRNIELNENEKLKQAIEILKRNLYISEHTYNIYFATELGVLEFGKDFNKEEYELLKEVLGNE